MQPNDVERGVLLLQPEWERGDRVHPQQLWAAQAMSPLHWEQQLTLKMQVQQCWQLTVLPRPMHCSEELRPHALLC